MYPIKKIKECCELAISNILKEGTTDVEILNKPFEIELLKIPELKKEIIDEVIYSINTCKFDKLKINKIGIILVPKKNLCDYRKCSIIDIIDEIKYLTLVLLIANDIEKSRIIKSKKKIYSYRFKPNKITGSLFDNEYNYTSFRNRAYEKTKNNRNKVVVECDIANFYDRLNIHRLESTLYSIKGIDTATVKIINEILLFWANRDSYGLPVGSNASRILAEASLIEIDNYLISHNIDFCRFVDDYRIYAKDAATAHKNLAMLVSRLSREGLFLNYSKTNIKEILKKDNKLKKDENESKTEEITNKIIRGYSGLIPLKFREISEKEREKLKKEDLEILLDSIDNNILIEAKEFILTLKTTVAKELYNKLPEISRNLDKFPQFIPYFVDLLLKNSDNIEDDIANKIKSSMIKWLKNDELPEYIYIHVVRLFSSEKFNNKETVFECFRNLKRNSGEYIGRAILESLNGNLTRGEIIEISQYYKRADIWERRQIIKIVQNGLSFGEKRPFLKDINIHYADIFEKYLSDPDKKISNKVFKYMK